MAGDQIELTGAHAGSQCAHENKMGALYLNSVRKVTEPCHVISIIIIIINMLWKMSYPVSHHDGLSPVT